jgi:excisionase family DNA binding protein
MKIKKICEYCRKEFIAKTTKTKYCCSKCNITHYKQRQREDRIQLSNLETESFLSEQQSQKELIKKEFLTIQETAFLLSVSRQTVYNWLNSGVLLARRLSNRKVLIYRQHLTDLFESRQAYERPKPKEREVITEFYTIEEVETLLNVKYRRLHDIIKKHRIPNALKGGKLFISKAHVDSYLLKVSNDVSQIKDWCTVNAIMEEYGITRDAVYGRVKDNSIPKKREGRSVLVSKKHFDDLYKVQL